MFASNPMPWWFDLVLLVAGVVLWIEGSNHQDDTIGLLEKILAAECRPL